MVVGLECPFKLNHAGEISGNKKGQPGTKQAAGDAGPKPPRPWSGTCKKRDRTSRRGSRCRVASTPFRTLRNVRCLTTNSAGAEQPHVRRDRFGTEAAAFKDLLFDRNRLRHVRLVSRARLGLHSAVALGVLLVSTDIRLAGRSLQSHS
jgi:hypothetical protein